MYQYAELVHWMKNPSKVIIPGSVDIDLTNLCNQDCYYCNSAEFRKQHPVQKEYTAYIDLLDKLHGWRGKYPDSYGTLHTVTYPGGGEPTLLRGYEHVVEHTIDLGFLTSITTNGSRLNKLVENVSVDKLRKMAWIGVDVDAGTEDLYEKIRKTIPAESIFSKVIENIQALVDIGVNVDLKILVGEYNSNMTALHDIFALASRLKVRQIYFRPVLLNGGLFPMQELIPSLDQLSVQYQVKIIYNTDKYLARNYKRCHQMFQFPVFCADGKIYTCCENRGNPTFAIGEWDTGDFRDLWLKDRHMQVYNSVNTQLCAPCRPNVHNIAVQEILNDPSKLENLYF
jgi:sulfatase maturation enzyme AslB (radical SAM superfamily)